MEDIFEKLVSVSGLPGIHKMLANRPNGLIIESLSDGNRRFAPSRKHQFTPLASIGVYTDGGETVEMKEVFQIMLTRESEGISPVDASSSSVELRDYFTKVLPNHDRDQVYPTDIKKLIKWYNFLKEKDLLPTKNQEEEE